MMFRVLIVDDEPEIRQGLRLKVDWDSLGLTVAGEASNGEEALERLADEPVDIVLTDMNMPFMDGVSFMEACSEQFPAVRLIVLTGYEDFHYARAAIQNHARDYLLKPVSREELTAAFRKVIQELEVEREEFSRQEAVQWQLSQYYQEIREHFLIQLVREDIKYKGGLRERARLLQLEGWNVGPVCFLAVGLTEQAGPSARADRTPDKLQKPFEMLCREFADTCAGHPLVFRDIHHPGLMHLILANDSKLMERVSAELRGCVISYLGFTPAIGAGSPVTGFQYWKEGYMSALLAWNMAVSNESEAFTEQPESMAALTEDSVNLIHRFLVRGELETMRSVINQELAAAYKESRVRYVKLIFQLYLLIESTAQEMGSAIDSGDQLWLRPDMALSLDTVDKAVQFLHGLAGKLHLKADDAREDSDTALLRAVLQFIDDKYMYDLSLTMIADKFNYNPSYFSEWFKAKVGKTFIQYVTEVRMGKAVQLLTETNLNLWDIAELTGFSNPSYFSSKFKKMYGMSPSDFRQQPPEKFNSRLPKN
jgi:two-component system response regulator YesN